MKKIIAILLAAVMTLGIFAVAASASYDFASLQNNQTEIINIGFNKNNADFFEKVARDTAGDVIFTTSSSLFTVDRTTGNLRFLSGIIPLLPQQVTVAQGDASKTINVVTQYQWYEYFVIVFAAGIFWIYTINNSRTLG